MKESLIMSNCYTTIMGSLSGLTDKELDEIIGQATAQLKRNRKDTLVKASRKVLDALKEYTSVIVGWHPLFDDGTVEINPEDFYINEDGYLNVR